MARIQVVIDEDERETFRAQARREGRSLSEWLREAGRDRLLKTQPPTLRTEADLDAFFAAIAVRHADEPAEEDWAVHKDRIARSRLAGLPVDDT